MINILFFFKLVIFLTMANSFSAIAENFDFPMSRKDTLKLKKEWVNVGFWLDPEFRLDFEGSNVAINYNRSFDKVIKKSFYQIGLQSAMGFNLGKYKIYQNSVNFGIGKRYLRRYFLATFFTGPGVIWGIKETGSYGTVGLISNLQIVGKPLKDFGIGIEIFNTLNVIRTLTGFRIVLHISSGK